MPFGQTLLRCARARLASTTECCLFGHVQSVRTCRPCPVRFNCESRGHCRRDTRLACCCCWSSGTTGLRRVDGTGGRIVRHAEHPRFCSPHSIYRMHHCKSEPHTHTKQVSYLDENFFTRVVIFARHPSIAPYTSFVPQSSHWCQNIVANHIPVFLRRALLSLVMPAFPA
jgi:hypothetical protein